MYCTLRTRSPISHRIAVLLIVVIQATSVRAQSSPGTTTTSPTTSRSQQGPLDLKNLADASYPRTTDRANAARTYAHKNVGFKSSMPQVKAMYKCAPIN